MGRIHIRIDRRKRCVDSGKAFHDLFHPQTVGGVHIRKNLFNFRLCCSDIIMYLIQLPGKLIHLLVDILIGLITAADVFLLCFLIPELIRVLQSVQQGYKLAL